MLDPNSPIPSAFEARVRARGVRITDGGKPQQVSTRSDFIAPDLSAPSTLAVELAKGERDWTDGDAPEPKGGYDPKTGRGVGFKVTGSSKPDPESVTVGKAVVRRPAGPKMYRMNRTGPARNRGVAGRIVGK